MQIQSKTDIGKIRETNQDSFFVGELDAGVIFVIVCDGMGGASAGNIASQMAVRSISEYLINSYRHSMDDFELEKILKNAITSANIEIYDATLKDPTLFGMGTTAVVAVVREERAVISHVGDSRAYLVRDELSQLTTDHSVVQSMIESGKLTAEEAKVHPRKNVITRAIGVEENVLADCVQVEMLAGDTLLICTDGLTNFVDAPDILSIFENTQITLVAQALVDKANANGGGDNITVVTVTK